MAHGPGNCTGLGAVPDAAPSPLFAPPASSRTGRGNPIGMLSDGSCLSRTCKVLLAADRLGVHETTLQITFSDAEPSSIAPTHDSLIDNMITECARPSGKHCSDSPVTPAVGEPKHHRASCSEGLAPCTHVDRGVPIASPPEALLQTASTA
jgi:hypothetical protein